MKILYDHQIFSIQKYGGISRYFVEIINHLPEDVRAEIGVRLSNNEYIKNLESSSLKTKNGIENFLMKTDFKGKVRLVYFLNQKFSIEQLKQQNFDVFHPTYYDDYFLDYLGKKPFVLTIHDMISEIYPETTNSNIISLQKANLAEKAAHIIAVSEKTKQDVIDMLGIHEEKISVVYHASPFKINSVRENFDFQHDYILFVGERSNYKNFSFFSQAIKPLLKHRRNLNVLCTGRSFNREEKEMISHFGLEERFKSVSVREVQLFNLYRNAKAFIFPSYYEGFGIPILEAFDAGCPVILSNSSCFPEIAGDGALYFDPKSADELVSAIEKILDDHDLRSSLIEKGRKRLENFSWSKAATQTTDIYNKVLA